MSTDLVTVTRLQTAAEVSPLRSYLEAAGIRTYLQGDVAGDVLSYYGGALGGVKLQVESSDVQRATELLQEHFQEKESKTGPDGTHPPAWICPQCNSEVDAGFELCWSCGEIYSDQQPTTQSPVQHHLSVESTGQSAALEPYAPATSESKYWFRLIACVPAVVLLLLIAEIAERFHVEQSYWFFLLLPLCLFSICVSIFVTPASELEPAETPEIDALSEPETTEETPADQLLNRAWKAAVIGVALLPPLTTIYSVLLLMEFNRSTPQKTPAQKRKFFTSITLNTIMLWIWMSVFLAERWMAVRWRT